MTEDVEAYVAKIVRDWPRLTDEQLDRIAALLMAGSRQPEQRDG